MTAVVTPAVVLHAFDYMESSRIVRLFTRDAGVQSALARGARSSRKRFGGGGALDLFVEGEAHFHVKPGRELHTLVGLDVTRSRPGLALEIGRFTAASALSELILRFARDDAQPALYDAFLAALDRLAAAPAGRSREAGLAGAWRLVAELGFAPSLDACGSCHEAIPADEPAAFSHPAGGVLCATCARLGGATRRLPPEARAALRRWTAEGEGAAASGELGAGGAPPLDEGAGRAHQRLLREFLREHLTDGRQMRAMEVWEGERWDVPMASSAATRATGDDESATR
jgi:DNA repair protein RecO (recombination protein O)